MKLIIQILLASSLMILFFACSELNNSLESAPQISVHKEGILDQTSPDFHGNLLRTLNWNIVACRQCHASNYTGGITGASCLNCHTEPEGPEACNTCHGDLNDPNRIAPPRDLSGNTSVTSRGVGAHDSHLYNTILTLNISCNNCHNVPTNFSDPVHIDGDNKAAIVFNGIAVTNQGINSNYNQNGGDCSNTYCHGNFTFYKDSAAADRQFIYIDSQITGNNVTINWTSVGQSNAECGSCHGLPPTGHLLVSLAACGSCHDGIFDRNGNIVDSLKYKHMNGEIDLYF